MIDLSGVYGNIFFLLIAKAKMTFQGFDNARDFYLSTILRRDLLISNYGKRQLLVFAFCARLTRIKLLR